MGREELQAPGDVGISQTSIKKEKVRDEGEFLGSTPLTTPPWISLILFFSSGFLSSTFLGICGLPHLLSL